MKLAHLGAGPEALVAAGAEFLEVDRGGSVTFHGPGQLVAYPIVRLAGIFPIPRHPAHGDVDRYLRALEAGLIATAGAYGVEVTRRHPYTGVWAGRAEARRNRRQARGWRHEPWCRSERRDRPELVRADHAVRHRRSRRRVARDPWGHRSQSRWRSLRCWQARSHQPSAAGSRTPVRWMRCSSRTHARLQRPESTPPAGGRVRRRSLGDFSAASPRGLRSHARGSGWMRRIH